MRFNIYDPHPGIRLNEIMPLSARARSWLARVVKEVPDDESIRVVGVVTMLEGLDYHHERFLTLVGELASYFLFKTEISPSMSNEDMQRLIPTSLERKLLRALDDEAVAYFNRLGQLHAFAKGRKLIDCMQKTDQIMVFRNKHTAHRSIDAPRRESKDEQNWQAMAFGFHLLVQGGFPIYQIVSDGVHLNFDMRNDHVVVMQEAIQALSATYQLQQLLE